VKSVVPLPLVVKSPSFVSKTIAVHGFDISDARDTYRLHRGLKNIRVDSQMLVQNKQSDNYTVIFLASKLGKGLDKLKPTLDILPLQLYPQRDRSTFYETV
jgi:hypothetical protein